jgi:hypothetical protein
VQARIGGHICSLAQTLFRVSPNVDGADAKKISSIGGARFHPVASRSSYGAEESRPC